VLLIRAVLFFVYIFFYYRRSRSIQTTYGINCKLDNDLIEWLSSTKKRKHEEEEECNAKRRYLTNMEYGEFTDFALCLVNKLERNEKQLRQSYEWLWIKMRYW